MQKVSHLISLLGGTGKVAKKLKINPSAISNWKKLNKIPNNKHSAILELGLGLDVNINEYLMPAKLNNIEGRVLLIICGGIASYKSLEVIRLIKKTSIDLDVIVTKSAQKFITPLLVTSLNEKKCFTDLFSVEDEDKMNHILLARKPSIILIAPATGNIMAKMANGIADDLASTVLLATNAKIILAPSMNPVMWDNIATQENYQKLLHRGIEIIEPENGNMACGEFGTGRLPDPNVIFENLISHFTKKENKINNLTDLSIIVTAGPTIENIDPVRFVSNKSSGKQGFEIASELTKRGAKVTLIAGPVGIPFPKCEKIIKVTSAEEMFDKTISELPKDIAICVAAVADWKFVLKNEKNKVIKPKNKIKKSDQNLIFQTIRNPDIIAEISKNNKKPKLVIGFSAETKDIIDNAKSKLFSKKIDLIVANDVSKDKVFGKDSNKVYLIDKNNCEEWVQQSKKSVAFNLANKINELLSVRL